MSSSCGRAFQAEPFLTKAQYRVGSKRNWGTAGLFQAQDAWGSPLADVLLVRLQRTWLRESGGRAALESELERVSSLSDRHLVLARSRVQIEQHDYLVLRGRSALTLDKFMGKVRRAGACPPPSVISRIFLDVAAGLGALHAQLAQTPSGLVSHGALSGTTIWIDGGGAAALLDCCLARAFPAQTRYATSGLFGQLGCRPPEALAQKPQDASSDIYSLTVLLCEALSGRHWFLRDSLDETLSAISDERRPLQAWQSELGLEPHFISKGLSPERADRYRSADEFAVALRQQLPPASRAETAAWVQHLAWDRRSSWPVSDSGRPSSTLVDDWGEEELTHRDVDEPTKVAPPGAADVDSARSEVVSALIQSVPPKLLRRLAEQDALERLHQEHSPDVPAPSDGVAEDGRCPEPARQRGSSGALRWTHVVLGVAIGVSACAVWENYSGVLWGGNGGLGRSAAPAVDEAAPPQRPPETPARASGAAERANGEPSLAQPKARPTADLNPPHADGPVSSAVAAGPVSQLAQSPGEPARVSSTPAARDADASRTVLEEDPAHSSPAADPQSLVPIRVPRRLHPRLNPLMTTQQVYPKQR